MAVRSTAGTGVIVSLVVFVITTVALLILTIVFYSGKVDAEEARDEAIAEMERFITVQQRNQDVFQRYIATAEQRRESVAMHMHRQRESIMRYVDGDGAATLDRLRARLQAFGVPEDGVVAHALQDKHRELRDNANQIEDLQRQLSLANDEAAELNSRIERIRREHRDALQAVEGEIDRYRQAAEEHREELTTTKRTMNEAVDRLQDRYDNQIAELEREIDDLHRDRVVMRSRVEDLQERLSAERIRAQDPSTLVDGRIIEIAGPEGEVYIDRGNRHRIVLGMTFEVYDSAASIRVDQRTGEMARGKSTIQIVRVHDDTSTARIIRSVPGRPVVRNDVIANAVYDPEYRFKFMVHGRFDLDGDGRATATEREFIEQLILDWGGELVTGDTIPGDLDFLVLGVVPPELPPLAPGATEAQFRDYVRQREARDRYMELFDQAREAQIPVLNHNRFLILTGQFTQR
jgi:hypothetical protein